MDGIELVGGRDVVVVDDVRHGQLWKKLSWFGLERQRIAALVGREGGQGGARLPRWTFKATA